MNLSIRVILDGEFGIFSAYTEVDGPPFQAFRQLDHVSTELGNYLPISNVATPTKLRFREEVAKEIADTLTEQLVELMKSKDTVNGYPVDNDF